MEKKLCFSCMQPKENPICEHCGFDERKQNESHQLPMGTVLKGQYLVGKVLGQGGFGITYLGYDRFLNLPVAIKEYYPKGVVMRNTSHSCTVTNVQGQTRDLFDANLRRFLREAQSLALLSEVPEVVHVRNYFPENGSAYIIMEYLQGITLKDYVRTNGLLTPDQAMEVFEPVMRGLQKVHEAGLVHRDISPDNIMLLPGNQVKLLDFGAVRDYNSELSQSTQAVVKAGFAPLEQYRATSQLDPRTDLYALCATMYYCMSGKLPPEAPERMSGDCDFQWDQISGLSTVQKAALQKGTALLPEDRFTDVDAFRDALQGKTPVKEPKKKKSARKWILPAAAAAIILIAAAGLLFLKPQKTEPTVSIEATETLPPKTQETVPETTIPEKKIYTLYSSGSHTNDYPCWRETTPDGYLYEGPGLKMQVTGRHLVIRVSSLENAESYPCNLPETKRYDTEYEWQLTFGDKFEEYFVSTGNQTLQKRSPVNKTIPEMDHELRLNNDGDAFHWLSGLEEENVSYDSASITWEFDIPEVSPDGFISQFQGGELTKFTFYLTNKPSKTYMLTRNYFLEPDSQKEDYEVCPVGCYAKKYPLTVKKKDGAVILSGTHLNIRMEPTGEMTALLDHVWTSDVCVCNNMVDSSGNPIEDLYWELTLKAGDREFNAKIYHLSDGSKIPVEVPMQDMEKGNYMTMSDIPGMFHLDSFTWNDHSITMYLSATHPENMREFLLSVDAAKIYTHAPSLTHYNTYSYALQP